MTCTDAFSIPSIRTEEEIFRHSHWQPRRARVMQALRKINGIARSVEQFIHCGAGAYLQWSETEQRYRVAASYCHSRHCEPCARAKANLIARNLRNHINERTRHEYRFVTLTLKHSQLKLADQIKKLYRSFKKLRARPFWKKTQLGGAFMVEVKHNGNEWHPHLHVITQGKFIKKEELSQEWLKATSDSMITDIRQLHHVKDAVHYVCKYITKSTSPNVWENDDLTQEWITASKGLRTCSTFGTWRGFKLLDHSGGPNDWTFVCKLEELWQRARDGEQHAINLIRILQQDKNPTEFE